jgi:hypothetical protein
VVAAAAAEAVAIAAGYGHHPGAGPTAVGVSPHLRLRYLRSRRSNPHKQQRLREKVTGISLSHEPNSVLRLELS